MSKMYTLQSLLREHFEDAFSTFPLALRGEGEAEQAGGVKVFLADKPLRGREDAGNAPFICLQERSGRHVDSWEEIEIICRCVAYSNSIEEAAHELSLLISTLRQSLFSCVTKPLDGEFFLIASEKGELLPWEKPLEQKHPYCEAYVLSTWKYKGFEFAYAGGE